MNFLNRFSKNTKISNFMKIRAVGPELFNAEGRTDEGTGMTKLKVAFRNFANAPKNPGHAVAHLVEALRYKLECRGFDSQ